MADFLVGSDDENTGSKDNLEKPVTENVNDDKHSQLDRRQEMLKKALERHKRGVKIKEVVINSKGGGNQQDFQPTVKMSKEDLMKKRAELDQRIKKVDEDREVIVKGKVAEASNSNIVAENTEVQEKKVGKVKQIEPDNVTAPETTAIVDKVKSEEQKEVEIKSTNSEPVAEDVEQEIIPKPERPQIDLNAKPQDTKTKSDGTSFARPHTPRPAMPKNDGTSFARPYTPRPLGEKPQTENRPYTPRPATEGTSFARPYTPRPKSDGTNFAMPYTPRKPGEKPSWEKSDNRTSSDRPYTPRGDRPFTPRGERSASDKPYTPRGQTGGRTGSPAGSSRGGSDSGGLTLTAEEERKRLVKKKEDDIAKDKDSKKPKTKKDLKKPKSWAKTITEGIDELNIEKEVEKPIPANIDISDLADVDPDKRQNRVASANYRGRYDKKPRRRGGDRSNAKVFVRPTAVEVGERIVLADLAGLLGVKATELIKKLFTMDIMATVNQSIDAETAQLLGLEYNIDVAIKFLTEDDLLPVYDDSEAILVKRPPIVTVMGHVDHGKTSLLDAIRSTSVATGEAGGITQHIGAYEVESASGKIIFLDTPGHEAFTTLRARGALLTDIVILVVAADDGVKPQTKEAIDHAKAAGVRIVVAINKIDKEGANPDKVRQQLAEHGIISEDWGGENQFQEISAKKRIGIDDLLERILLEAEILDLQGCAERPAEGIVIESRLDKQKGPVATVLIKEGTLNRGDTFISGQQFGKVRAMFNFKGVAIKEAGLSIPVEVMGFSDTPEAGEKFIVLDEKVAKQIAELRANANKEKQQLDRGGKMTLADIFGKIQDGELKELAIVLKADAQGSAEALITSLMKLSNQEVKVNIIHDGIGAITESDVALANASNAIIIGFNVRPDNNARQLADKESVDIELYSVIYKAIDDVKLALEGLLSPEMKETVVGKVELRQIFSVPKIGKIAGCFVLEGKINRNSKVRIIRDSIVIFDGKISSLKRFTDDVREVVAGYECGLSVDKYQDIKEGDILEVYEVTEEKRTLEDVAKAKPVEEKL